MHSRGNVAKRRPKTRISPVFRGITHQIPNSKNLGMSNIKLRYMLRRLSPITASTAPLLLTMSQ